MARVAKAMREDLRALCQPAKATSESNARLGVGNTFEEFLERIGFHADACEACIEPDFYRLAKTLWETLGKAKEAMDERRGYAEAWEWKYGKAWDKEDSIVQATLDA